MAESLLHKETERQRMETQFRQSQKMEAVGTMAGGLAHDFKNIITAITGFANLVKMSLEEDDPAREYAEHILSSSARASTLVQSLLAFSRQQIISPKPVSVNNIIRGVEKILRRLIREDIEFRTDLSAKNLVVMADTGQIEQALMNLCTNARDAMPEGGVLTISTWSVELGEGSFSNYGAARPGTYAAIAVADTGIGMDEETKARIFEPFFTTKDAGKGTGLGLSTVYGIIKQHEGFVDVRSEPGKGSLFSMYFPLIHSETGKEMGKKEAVLKKGTETVLVAEDDEDVRLYIHDILRLFGYTVIEAIDGEDAVQKFSDRPNVDLLVFDIIMPRKNGKEAYEEIRAMSPGIRALFISGYTGDVIDKKGILEEGVNYIGKPISPEELLGKVREVLDKKE
jgi:nitrogen-specific signal transduction histidine kinase/ActR/RegA family two-component response regulator